MTVVVDTPSPSSCFKAKFTPAFELRPDYLPSKADGLLLWHLSIGDIAFPGRTFYPPGIWSRDSRYFAVTEVTGYSAPAQSLSVDTRLIVIDCPSRLECLVAKQSRGEVLPQGFESEILVFSRETDGARGFKYIREISFTDFKTWLPIQGR